MYTAQEDDLNQSPHFTCNGVVCSNDDNNRVVGCCYKTGCCYSDFGTADDDHHYCKDDGTCGMDYAKVYLVLIIAASCGGSCCCLVSVCWVWVVICKGNPNVICARINGARGAPAGSIAVETPPRTTEFELRPALIANNQVAAPSYPDTLKQGPSYPQAVPFNASYQPVVTYPQAITLGAAYQQVPSYPQAHHVGAINHQAPAITLGAAYQQVPSYPQAYHVGAINHQAPAITLGAAYQQVPSYPQAHHVGAINHQAPAIAHAVMVPSGQPRALGFAE
jgi:hypothetical protein